MAEGLWSEQIVILNLDNVDCITSGAIRGSAREPAGARHKKERQS